MLPLWVLAGCVVVAMGAGGAGASGPIFADWPFRLRTAGAVLALIGFAVLRWQSQKFRDGGGRGPGPAGVAVRMAGMIMGIMVWLAFIAPHLQRTERVGVGDSDGARSVTINPDAPPSSLRPPPLTPPMPTDPAQSRELIPPQREEQAELADGQSTSRPGSSSSGLFGGLGQLLLLFLLLGIAAGAISTLIGSMGRRDERDGASAEAAEEGLSASLAHIGRFSDDPRGQITTAYHRLLDSLVEAGAPRHPHEAPHEHLFRCLAPLGIRPAPLHRLAELYVMAQFSRRPVTEEHRAAAEEALAESLADLRVAEANRPRVSLQYRRAGGR